VRAIPRLLTALIALAVALAIPTVALASLPSDVGKGERLAETIRSGETQCSGLAADDFELIGEYAMSRYLRDPALHEAMNRRMTLMMGSAGEEHMHEALGHRYSGCPGGPAAGWIGAMGGMMTWRHAAESVSTTGMMGGYRGGMMGFGSSGDGDVSVLGAILIAFGAAALGGGLVLLSQRLSRSGHEPPAAS
jgi:hypothetical protein